MLRYVDRYLWECIFGVLVVGIAALVLCSEFLAWLGICGFGAVFITLVVFYGLPEGGGVMDLKENWEVVREIDKACLFIVGLWISILLFVTCPVWGIPYVFFMWLKREGVI